MVEILAITLAIVLGVFFGIYYMWKKLLGGALQTALVEFFNVWHEKESFAEVGKDIAPSQHRRISDDMKEIAELAKAPANRKPEQIQRQPFPDEQAYPEPRFEGVPQAPMPDAAYDGQTYNQPLVAPSDAHQAQIKQQNQQVEQAQQVTQSDVNAQFQPSNQIPPAPPQTPQPEHLTQNQVNAEFQPSENRQLIPENQAPTQQKQPNPNNDLQPLVEDNTFKVNDPVIDTEYIDPETPSADVLDAHVPKGNRFPYGVRTSTTDSPNRRIRDKRYTRNAAD